MAYTKKEIEIVWPKEIKIDFDYREFAKGIQLPEGTKWQATILE